MQIYQIFYNELSKSKLSPHFIPYDNRNPPVENEFEYGVMRNLYLHTTPFDRDKYLGVLSWKFQDKTKLYPVKILDWMKKNKGYDIYTINPFPYMSKCFGNVWDQGEYYHPGLFEMVSYLFKEAGLDLPLNGVYSPKVTCYCNYWIGNKKFWDLYMAHTEKLYNTLYEIAQRDVYIHTKLFTQQCDQNIKSGMFSFIFERMFSTILNKYQKEFKILPYYT